MSDFRVARGVSERPVARIGREGAEVDAVVVEEPLEIRVAGDPVAVTMRTPGHDERLALGFLFGEGIVRGAEDVGSIAHCGRVGEEGFGNVIDVLPAPGVALAPERSKRGTVTTSACGVCGRLTIADLLARVAPIDDDTRVDPARAVALVGALTEAQPLFARTGGIHAAAVFDVETGERLASFEDVGRHNAVDKTIGELLVAKRVPARGTALVVSGRISFEIVQKALVARIPILLGVSAASSLAIDLATKSSLGLAGFVRGTSMNVYATESRFR